MMGTAAQRVVAALAMLACLACGAPEAMADQHVVMVTRRLGCRSIMDVLAIMQLADDASRQGADLSAARAALKPKLDSGTCREIEAGAAVTILDRQERDSFPFLCLKTDRDPSCMWVSSFGVRLP